jgi:hypothetical protein
VTISIGHCKDRVKVFNSWWRFCKSIKEYLHGLYAKFEHKLHYSGGSGDSGGIFSILLDEYNVLIFVNSLFHANIELLKEYYYDCCSVRDSICVYF